MAPNRELLRLSSFIAQQCGSKALSWTPSWRWAVWMILVVLPCSATHKNNPHNWLGDRRSARQRLFKQLSRQAAASRRPQPPTGHHLAPCWPRPLQPTGRSLLLLCWSGSWQQQQWCAASPTLALGRSVLAYASLHGRRIACDLACPYA